MRKDLIAHGKSDDARSCRATAMLELPTVAADMIDLADAALAQLLLAQLHAHEAVLRVPSDIYYRAYRSFPDLTLV